MPEENQEPDDPTWLLQPPQAGEIHLHIAVGDEVELSPEARSALETLTNHLQDAEVMGFAQPCGSLDACGGYVCRLGKCLPLTKQPNCVAYTNCKVADFGTMF